MSTDTGCAGCRGVERERLNGNTSYDTQQTHTWISNKLRVRLLIMHTAVHTSAMLLLVDAVAVCNENTHEQERSCGPHLVHTHIIPGMYQVPYIRKTVLPARPVVAPTGARRYGGMIVLHRYTWSPHGVISIVANERQTC